MGKLPRGVLKSLGLHRMGQRPRIPVSREHWRSSVSLVLRLRVSSNISSKSLVFYLLSSCHCLSSASEAIICIPGTWRTAKAATLRPFAKTRVPFLIFWDCFWPNP